MGKATRYPPMKIEMLIDARAVSCKYHDVKVGDVIEVGGSFARQLIKQGAAVQHIEKTGGPTHA